MTAARRLSIATLGFRGGVGGGGDTIVLQAAEGVGVELNTLGVGLEVEQLNVGVELEVLEVGASTDEVEGEVELNSI